MRRNRMWLWSHCPQCRAMGKRILAKSRRDAAKKMTEEESDD